MFSLNYWSLRCFEKNDLTYLLSMHVRCPPTDPPTAIIFFAFPAAARSRVSFFPAKFSFFSRSVAYGPLIFSLLSRAPGLSQRYAVFPLSSSLGDNSFSFPMDRRPIRRKVGEVDLLEAEGYCYTSALFVKYLTNGFH